MILNSLVSWSPISLQSTILFFFPEMGSQVLRISSFPPSRTFFFLNTPTKTSLSRCVTSRHSPTQPPALPKCLCNIQFPFSSSKPINSSISTTGSVKFFHLSKRSSSSGVVAMAAPGSVQKSEEEWRANLSPEQFRILRQKGTEYPGNGQYDKFYEEGIYNCAGCGTPLYKSMTKFNSGCGWPAFYEGLPGAINRNTQME
ncbi:peptide methionine sulfoxide reductase B2, chloroplastic-like isoform X2 [Malania oleifera]|uniref:peptide methionine sulfoxide reductase B2, chloroplastic-like isoform X2 n=1 Tax=Malania oleifera TaxID=397392 RepID=UPI0025ADFE02|nr:peptide methionine sulfoxide reductase B2, chloroplastic-like isoform X2 [Malania oleifera]